MAAAVLIVGELFLRAALGEHVRAQRGFLGAEKDAADALLAATITNVYRQNYVVHPYYGYTMKPLLDGSPFGWKRGPTATDSTTLLTPASTAARTPKSSSACWVPPPLLAG